MAFRSLLFLLSVCSAVLAATVSTEDFGDGALAKIKANMQASSTRSWEIGTALEALTELECPELSVFGGTIPPLAHRPTTCAAADVIEWVASVVKKINDRTAAHPLIDADGAVGDPASIGIAVLLANWTHTDFSDNTFAVAAKNQLDYLLTVAPRTTDGAISHRASEVQLWADFIYMAPPFIAYYGAVQGGESGAALLSEAYNQCRLYRKYLIDEGGLWKHIVLGSFQDNNHWATGNAWAAAGMLRVLETIARSSQADVLQTEQADLTTWIDEILTRVWAFQDSSGALYNYIDQRTSFPDTSSTALLAAVSFRLAKITKNQAHLPNAYRALKLVKDSVTADGWLLSTVDPMVFNAPSRPGNYSPEGQAFALLLHAAWRDFVASEK